MMSSMSGKNLNIVMISMSGKNQNFQYKGSNFEYKDAFDVWNETWDNR